MRKNIIYNYFKRGALLMAGLFIMAFGIALSVKSNLGTSPAASVPYILSMILPWSMGQLTFGMQTIFVLIQILLLKKDFELIQLLQLAAALLFGFFTDITLSMVSGLEFHNYILQWILCLISFFFVALGIFLEVKANIVMPSGQGLVKVLAKIRNSEFSKTKVYYDSTFVIIGAAISLFTFHKLIGIKEGTIAAAVIVGMLVKLMDKAYSFIL
ncbi:MAG: YczE/YyaS/YitT family protein [Solirubrobacterales bacterium]